MTDNSIYSDIAKRTGGDIYIGVVGPVRTGKSTFIKRFLDCIVLPNIKDEYDRERTQDQTPQSAGGRTVMTTEPKFVPDEAVRITVGDGTELMVKLVDCVGYMVDGALGGEEDGTVRMIKTPWREEPMPLKEAAELGTAKVIGEHSTIGMLVTSDGSFGELARESFIAAEERVARELSELGKPFAIILNSARPSSKDARTLAAELEAKYHAPVALVSCPDLSAEDISAILELVLGEFPISRLDFRIPEWCEALPEGHPIGEELIGRIRQVAERSRRLGDLKHPADECEGVSLVRVDAGEGVGEFEVPISDERFYRTLGELTGFDVSDKKKLLALLLRLRAIEKKYLKIEDALRDAEEKGYGIVMPEPGEMTLEEPQIVKTTAGCGVKIAAHAESIHMIKTGISAELCPTVGSEEQTAEVVRHLSEQYELGGERVWETNMLGKTLYDLVRDGMWAKLQHMPDESRVKMGETIEKIINDGANGLICILL